MNARSAPRWSSSYRHLLPRAMQPRVDRALGRVVDLGDLGVRVARSLQQADVLHRAAAQYWHLAPQFSGDLDRHVRCSLVLHLGEDLLVIDIDRAPSRLLRP